MKIKMTFTLKEKNLFAGLIYEVPDEEAEQYIKNQQAVPFVEEQQDEPKRMVKRGNGKNLT